ncbi:MAG: hypothetical protein AAFN27_18600 [Pseudomonadota bacterium]
MSDQDESEFLRSLQRVREAHYSRDPKRRAIESVERQMQQDRTILSPDGLSPRDLVTS